MKVCDIDLYGSIRNGKVWNVYLEDARYAKAYRSFYDFGRTVFTDYDKAQEALAGAKESIPGTAMEREKHRREITEQGYMDRKEDGPGQEESRSEAAADRMAR